MTGSTETPRRTRDGSYIVPVDSLALGDLMRLTGGGVPVWWPILRIEEKPKSRRVFVGVRSTGTVAAASLLRRTTLVARAPREGETA